MTNKRLINIFSRELTSNNIEIGFKINPEHIVFKGHFPDNPIVPGVLEMQVAEMFLLESLLIDAKLFSISNVKFSRPIFPNNNNSYLCQINYLINEGFLECVIFIKDCSFTYMSMQSKYKIENKHAPQKSFEKITIED